MNEQDLDVRRTAAAIRRAKRMVVALAVAGAAAGVGLAMARPGPDQATAIVLLPGVLTQAPGSTTPDVQTQVVLAESTPVLLAAIQHTHTSMSPATLRKHLKVTTSSPEVLSVMVQTRTGAQAERLANAIATSYVSYVTTSGTTGAGSSIAGLNTEVHQLTLQSNSAHSEVGRLEAALKGNSLTANARQQDAAAIASLENEQSSLNVQISSLNSQIGQARLNTILANGSVRVLQRAVTYVDTAPLRMALFGGGGLVIGLVAGVWWAILRAGRRRRLYRRADLAAAVGLPVVASLGVGRVRRTGDWHRLLERPPSSVDAWNLRRVLHLLDVDGPDAKARAHVLTLDGDRAAAAVAALLAAAAARRGVPTALVYNGPKVPAALRAACATPNRAQRPPTLTVAQPGADATPPARLTVVGLTVAPRDAGEASALQPGRAFIGVTAGYATSDDVARLALAASDGGLEPVGLIVVNPDDRDATIGEAPLPREPGQPAPLGKARPTEPILAVDGE